MRAARVGLKAGAADGAAEADVWAIHVSVKARGFVSLSAACWAAGRRERKGAGHGVGRAVTERDWGLGWASRKGVVALGLGFSPRGLGCFGFPNPFLFLFPSLLTQTNLNSNKFEFETLFTQTNKIMHQHECNNKIIPMINFNYLWNKK